MGNFFWGRATTTFPLLTMLTKFTTKWRAYARASWKYIEIMCSGHLSSIFGMFCNSWASTTYPNKMTPIKYGFCLYFVFWNQCNIHQMKLNFGSNFITCWVVPLNMLDKIYFQMCLKYNGSIKKYCGLYLKQ